MKVFVLTTDLVPIKGMNEGRVVSVFLTESRSGGHNFRCIECGKIKTQYTGDVGYIFDGAVIPEEKPVLDILCTRCKIMYRFFVV